MKEKIVDRLYMRLMSYQENARVVIDVEEG